VHPDGPYGLIGLWTTGAPRVISGASVVSSLFLLREAEEGVAPSRPGGRRTPLGCALVTLGVILASKVQLERQRPKFEYVFESVFP
jgi:hypothetical protein